MFLKLKSILCAFALFSGLITEYCNTVKPEVAPELQNLAGDAHPELPVEKSRYAVFFDEELPSKVFREVIEWANTNNIKINEEMNKKYIKFLSLDLSPKELEILESKKTEWKIEELGIDDLSLLEASVDKAEL